MVLKDMVVVYKFGVQQGPIICDARSSELVSPCWVYPMLMLRTHSWLEMHAHYLNPVKAVYPVVVLA